MTERTSGRERGLRPARRLAAAALTLGALAPLAACGGSGPQEAPPAADDVPAYEVARQDVLAAVQQVVGADGWAQDDDASATAQDDGRCVVFLPDASTTRAGVPDALAPVLDEHGFGEPSGVEEAEHGGTASVTAVDAAGWEVRVTADGDVVRLDMAGPVALDPCAGSALPELA